MGFASQDDLINEVSTNGKFDYAIRNKTISTAQVAAFWTNLGVFAGSEPASAYPGTSLTFVPTDDTWADGAWPHGGDVSPDTKHFLYAGANIVAAAGAPWFLLAVDQVGYVPITGADVTGTTGRTITMTPIAATAAKVDRYPNGVGLRAFFSTEVAPTAGGPNMTAFGYKNVAGASKTCPVTVGMAATPVIGAVPHSGGAATRYAPFIPMAAGDTGISDLESFTWTGGTAYTGTGQMVLHLVKPLWGIPLPASGIHNIADFINALPNMARIRDGACIQWMLMNTGATTANAPLLVESAHGWG
jgi:hypothetical protein